MSYVRYADSESSFNAILDAKSTGLVVVDWFAQWCQPCHAISPHIDALSKSVGQTPLCEEPTDTLVSIPMLLL